jgi:hypothetical protein
MHSYSCTVLIWFVFDFVKIFWLFEFIGPKEQEECQMQEEYEMCF